MIQYSLVVPVYNNAEGLKDLFEALQDSLFSSSNNEIIFVDDGSNDDSWNKLKALKSFYSTLNISLIKLSRNFGQHGATLSGFNASKGAWVCTIDDDLEVLPQEFNKLINVQISSKSMVVYGEYRKAESFLMKGIKGIYRVLSRFQGKNRGRGSSFRILQGDLARTMASNHKFFVFIDEFVLWYTDKISFVEVDKNSNPIKKSRYSFPALFRTSVKSIMYGSQIPLKMMTSVGFILALVNFLYGVLLIYRNLFDKIKIDGYTSIMVAILFSTGIIILTLGIITHYLQTMMKNLNKAPSFHVEERA